MQSVATSAREADELLLQQQLSELREEFREFVYRVSHDINAPMRSVVNFSELLRKKYGESVLDSQAHEYLDYITKGVTQTQSMLAGLLEYSRINTMSNPPQEIDCNLVLERCLRELRGSLNRCEAAIKADALPILIAEQKQLEKLFSILIANAIGFRCPDRPLEIHISAMKSKRMWQFSFTDNGIGIEPKHQEEIFQIFRYIHQGLSHPGLGIGLALARKIVRHHRGEIGVSSDTGKGATFHFTLPADDLLLREGLL